jgi:hypothetical protein
MASYAYTFSSGDTVTPQRINDARTVSAIVNADIDAAAAIAGSKLANDSVSLAKLVTAVQNALVPAGAVQPFARSTAPSGWLAANGSTIGSASSGATNASADYSALFAVLWDNWTNTDLPILDSAGAASTRGASASADFAANKRLPLPDLCGIFVRGSGSQTISGTSYSGTFAAKSADALKTHTHTFSATSGGESLQHGHTVNSIITTGFGGSSANITTGGGGYRIDNVATTFNGSGHTHSVSGTTGNPSTGTSTETRPANIALLYCIKF